jgi:hypothetical protein
MCDALGWAELVGSDSDGGGWNDRPGWTRMDGTDSDGQPAQAGRRRGDPAHAAISGGVGKYPGLPLRDARVAASSTQYRRRKAPLEGRGEEEIGFGASLPAGIGPGPQLMISGRLQLKMNPVFKLRFRDQGAAMAEIALEIETRGKLPLRRI